MVNLRLQLLFTIAPALLLLSLHDVLSLIIHHISALDDRQDLAEAIVTLPAFAMFLIFSPEILRRVLHTEPLPDCPLRRRLERIARQYHVGYRDVLLWKTESQMGNAAVMGFVPRFRYVLLSDLLLETMRDEQIEAIFAHEIGHVIHRHLYWLVAALAAMLFALAGPGQTISDAFSFTQSQHPWLSDSVQTALMLAFCLGVFGLVFGFVSRKFERQADVFAARTMQSEFDAAAQRNAPATLLAELETETTSTAVLEVPGMTVSGYSSGYVGEQGAAAFCTALERVAIVNNIPIAARSWCHGSIAKRIRFVQALGRDARRTAQFDRLMSRIYILLTACLCGFGAWTAVVLIHQSH
jgi:STE24 endopeptidase